MDRFLHQHNIHSNFYILNPQTNTQKQKLLREEQNSIYHLWIDFYILSPQTNTQKQKHWERKWTPKKKKNQKKKRRRTQTTKSLSDLTIMGSSMTKTATTTRFVLLHDGEGGSVSEWEWGWGWDVSVWTWFVTLRVLVELIKERPWISGECLLGPTVKRAWTSVTVWGVGLRVSEVWDWQWARPWAV